MADPFAELMISGASSARAVALQRMFFEGEVARRRLSIDETNWSGLVDEPSALVDVWRWSAAIRLCSIGHDWWNCPLKAERLHDIDLSAMNSRGEQYPERNEDGNYYNARTILVGN